MAYTIRFYDCAPPPPLTQSPFIMSNPSISARRVPAPPPPPPQDRVVLEMDLTTAEILREVLARIGGPMGGPRGHMERLRQDLDEVGITTAPFCDRYTVPGTQLPLR